MLWYTLCIIAIALGGCKVTQIGEYSDPTPSHNDAERTRPLLADRKGDFKLENFEVIPSVHVPDTWGFADKNVLPLDHRPFTHGEGSYTWAAEHCKDQFAQRAIPAYRNGPDATAIYYTNHSTYKEFRGIDLIPENKNNYPHSYQPYLHTLSFDRKDEIMPGEELVIRECRLPTPRDGGAFHVQRMGPFISKGGYDWWQFAWEDVYMLSEVFAKHSEGVDLDVQWMIPVTEDGVRLGYPPIHVHHIHAVPSPGSRNRLMASPLCTKEIALWGLHQFPRCFNTSLFIEQHGDYQCSPQDDGMDCLVTGDNNLRRVHRKLDIEGDLNDVRPAGSPPLRWYIEIGAHWKPIAPSKEPVSQMTIMAPMQLDFHVDQLSRFGVFRTPTAYESFIWYRGAMWTSGRLIRNKLHAHTAAFTIALWMLGRPEDLGLSKEGFIGDPGFNLVRTQSVGFDNNVAFLEYVFENLRQAQDQWDTKCGSREACGRPRPDFVCAAKHTSALFEFPEFLGKFYQFDRRPFTYCKPWDFEKGDEWVSIGTFPRVTWPVLPVKSSDDIPEFYPGHISWHFWYHHYGWFHSFFGRIVCSQGGIFFDARDEFGWADLVGMLVANQLTNEGGTSFDRSSLDSGAWLARIILPCIPVALLVGLLLGGRKLRRIVKHYATPTD